MMTDAPSLLPTLVSPSPVRARDHDRDRDRDDHPDASPSMTSFADEANASMSIQADMLASAAATRAEKSRKPHQPTIISRHQQRPVRRLLGPGGLLRSRSSRDSSSHSSTATGAAAATSPAAADHPVIDPALAEIRISERDARIESLERELEASNSSVLELRSELVQLRASSREERYRTEERMECIKEENLAFAMKVVSLEERLLLSECGGSVDNLTATSRSSANACNGTSYDKSNGEGNINGDRGQGQEQLHNDLDDYASDSSNLREEDIDGPSMALHHEPDTAPEVHEQRQLPTQDDHDGPTVTLDKTYVAALRSQVDRYLKVILRLDNELGQHREHSASMEEKLRKDNATLKAELDRSMSQLEVANRQVDMIRHEANSKVEDMAAKLECRESTVRSMYQKILARSSELELGLQSGGSNNINDGGKYLEELREEIRDLKERFDYAQVVSNAGPGMSGFLGADCAGVSVSSGVGADLSKGLTVQERAHLPRGRLGSGSGPAGSGLAGDDDDDKNDNDAAYFTGGTSTLDEMDMLGLDDAEEADTCKGAEAYAEAEERKFARELL